MMWWSAHRRASENLTPAWRIEDVLSWALMGLWFGIVTTFHWRQAFHMPLVIVLSRRSRVHALSEQSEVKHVRQSDHEMTDNNQIPHSLPTPSASATRLM
jgi:hypothetical protein